MSKQEINTNYLDEIRSIDLDFPTLNSVKI